MAIDISQIQTFTDTDLLVLMRNAYAQISLGQSYTIGTRTLTRADLASVQDQISWLESRVNADGNGLGSGSAFVQFNEPN